MSPLIGVPTRLTMTMPAPADATAPLHLMGHPASYVDASGRMAFLVVLMIAAIAAATLGAVGAAANKVKTWDELVLWVIGGASGAVWGWKRGRFLEQSQRVRLRQPVREDGAHLHR